MNGITKHRVTVLEQVARRSGENQSCIPKIPNTSLCRSIAMRSNRSMLYYITNRWCSCGQGGNK